VRARVSENKPIADGTLGPHKRVRVQLQLSRILLISVHYEDATTYISTLVFVWTASQECLAVWPRQLKGHETAPQWALYCTATIVL
jgi:hypothetical protein